MSTEETTTEATETEAAERTVAQAPAATPVPKEAVATGDLGELRETYGEWQQAQQQTQYLRQQLMQAVDNETAARGAHAYVARRVNRTYGLTDADTIALADGAITHATQ